ncbi:MAG: hypothetical protein PWR04_378 [Anaerophaga sp.]|nr:hypothetical protein [Anaerophaga sp.]
MFKNLYKQTLKNSLIHPYKIYLLRADGTRMQDFYIFLLWETYLCSFHLKSYI